MCKDQAGQSNRGRARSRRCQVGRIQAGAYPVTGLILCLLLASRFSVLDLCCLWIISRFLFVFSFHVSRFSLLIFSRFFSVSFLNFVSRSSILDSRCSLPAASSCFPFLVSHCTLQVHYAVPENRNKKRNADTEYNNR
jgi:hypothetical protein